MVGDLGGTQVRLRVYQGEAVVFSEDSLTCHSKSLEDTLLGFINAFKEKMGIEEHQLSKAVFGIAGPVEEDGTVPIIVDIP